MIYINFKKYIKWKGQKHFFFQKLENANTDRQTKLKAYASLISKLY